MQSNVSIVANPIPPRANVTKPGAVVARPQNRRPSEASTAKLGPPPAKASSPTALKAATSPKPPPRNAPRTMGLASTPPVKTSARNLSLPAPVRPASSPPTNRPPTKAPAPPASRPIARKQVVPPKTPSLPRANTNTAGDSGLMSRPSSCPGKISRAPVGPQKADARAKVLGLSQRLKLLHLVEAMRSNQLSTIAEKPVAPKVPRPVASKRSPIPPTQARPKVTTGIGRSSTQTAPLAIRPETPQNAAPPPRPTVPTPRTAEFGPLRDRKRIPKVERPAPIKLPGRPVVEGLGPIGLNVTLSGEEE